MRDRQFILRIEVLAFSNSGDMNKKHNRFDCVRLVVCTAAILEMFRRSSYVTMYDNW